MIEVLLEFIKNELMSIIEESIDENNYSFSVSEAYYKLYDTIRYNNNEILFSDDLVIFIENFLKKYETRIRTARSRDTVVREVTNSFRTYVTTMMNKEKMPKRCYAEIVNKYKYSHMNLSTLFKSIGKGIEFKVPDFLKEFTYEGMVKDYFGLDLIVGDNAPKLSKQLSLNNIEHTAKELEAFGQLKEFFNRSEEHKLYIDTENMEIPFIMDNWSPNSCHKREGAGNFTHFENKLLGFSMLRIYSQKYRASGTLSPYMRTYFYKKDDDIAHAGSYSYNNFGGGYPLYTTTNLILCVLFNKRLEDFKQFSGLPEGYYNERFSILDDDILDQVPDWYADEDIAFWNNMHCETSYTKYTTNENIFDSEDFINITDIADTIREDSSYYIVDYFNATITDEQDNLYMEEK